MFLPHYASFLITSCRHNFEDYIWYTLYMVLRRQVHYRIMCMCQIRQIFLNTFTHHEHVSRIVWTQLSL